MSKPKRSRLLPVLVPIFLALAGYLAWRTHQYSLWKQHLTDAVSDADSIVLDLNVKPESSRTADHYPLLPTCEIKGRDAVRSFLDAVEFTSEGRPCACYGDLKILFRKAGQTLAALTYKDGNVLISKCYGTDGGWRIGVLSADSGSAVRQWLTERGGAAYAEAKAEGERLNEAWRKQNLIGNAGETRPVTAPATPPAVSGGTRQVSASATAP